MKPNIDWTAPRLGKGCQHIECCAMGWVLYMQLENVLIPESRGAHIGYKLKAG